MINLIKGPSRSLILVVTMCVAEICGMAGYSLWPAMIPDFQVRWNLSSTSVGWIGGSYFFGFAIATWPLSSLTDRVDPKKVYLLCMSISFIGTIGFAVNAEGFWTAIIWRTLQGIGLAGTYMPGLKLLTDIVPESDRSRSVAWYTALFYVGAALSLYIGMNLNGLMNWKSIWIFVSIGPAFALLIVWLILPATPPKISYKSKKRLLDLRTAINNPKVMGYTIAYFAHCAELMGFATWIVAFLTYSLSLQHAGATGTTLSIGTIATFVTLLAFPSSVIGYELSALYGRLLLLRVVMFGSAIVAIILGFSASFNFPIILCLLVLYGITVTADSATITAGLVEAADQGHRGTVMATYSLIGFIGASIGPVVFGFMLDLGGGESNSLGWKLGFISLAVMVCLGPFAIAQGHKHR